MDRFDAEQQQLEARRAGAARVCSFICLLLSTMMVVRVQQARLDAAASRGRRPGKLQFPWEAAPFLASDTSLLSSAYLSSSQDFASVFLSSRTARNCTTVFVGASRNASVYEDPFWAHEAFTDVSRLTATTQATNVVSPGEPTSSLLAMSLDVSLLESPSFLPGCYSGKARVPKCFVSLTQQPLSACLDTNNADAPISWSCMSARRSATDASKTKCIEVVGGTSLQDLRKPPPPTAKTKTPPSAASESAFPLRICADPIGHVLAVDNIGSRLFFLQNNTRATPGDGIPTAKSKTDQDLQQREGGICVSVVHLDPYYGDISPCTPIPEPSALAFDPQRPPVYLHFDAASQSLAIFRFDRTSSLVTTVLDTASPNLPLKFSIRFEHMASAWILASEDASKSTVLVLGDKAPYSGVLHVVDLTRATDTRLNSQRHRFHIPDDNNSRRRLLRGGS